MPESDLLNLYDSEVATLQRIQAELQARTYKTHNLDAFDKEIVERFAQDGFRVNVLWYQTTVEGVFAPEIEVIGRCAPIQAGDFDHDQMRHEVVTNVLGLPEADAGVIKSTATWHSEKCKPGCGH